MIQMACGVDGWGHRARKVSQSIRIARLSCIHGGVRISGKRTHSRAFGKLKKAFFEEGQRLDAAGDPAADCWICHKRIDYSVPPGTTDLSHELDHYYPVSEYPELQEDPAGFRHSHRKCNRERGNGQPALDMGDVIPAWW